MACSTVYTFRQVNFNVVCNWLNRVLRVVAEHTWWFTVWSSGYVDMRSGTMADRTLQIYRTRTAVNLVRVTAVALYTAVWILVCLVISGLGVTEQTDDLCT